MELKVHFPVSQKTKRHLRLAIENELRGESEFINADKFLKKLKEEDPTIGTPQGALLAYKDSRGWTQKSLSEKTGISQPDISKLLNGKENSKGRVGSGIVGNVSWIIPILSD